MTARDLRPSDVSDRRQLAVDLFNHVWTLLERSDRAPPEDDEMLHAAHASRTTGARSASRSTSPEASGSAPASYAVLGRAEPALWHASRCLALCEEHGIADWDMAFAHEAVARALSVAGDRDGARAEVARARELATEIAEDEDRELLLSDLQTIGAKDGR